MGLPIICRNVVIWVLLNPHTRIKKNFRGKIENNNESSRATDPCLTSSSEKRLGLARLQRVLSIIVALKGVVRVSKEISRIAAANLLSTPCAYLFVARSLTAAFAALSVSPPSKSPLSIKSLQRRIARRNTPSLHFNGHGLSTKDHPTRAIKSVPARVHEIGFQV